MPRIYNTSMRTVRMTGQVDQDAQHQALWYQDVFVQQQTTGEAWVGFDPRVKDSGTGIQLFAGQTITVPMAPNQKLYFFGDKGVRVSLMISVSLIQIQHDLACK